GRHTGRLRQGDGVRNREMGEGRQVLRRLDRVRSAGVPWTAGGTPALPGIPMTRKRPEELRSHRWFGVNDLRAFGHRSRLRQFGYDLEDWHGKPVIGIINTWSDINACHGHLRARAEDVKRGITQAGGLPIELPAESLARP